MPSRSLQSKIPYGIPYTVTPYGVVLEMHSLKTIGELTVKIAAMRVVVRTLQNPSFTRLLPTCCVTAMQWRTEGEEAM